MSFFWGGDERPDRYPMISSSHVWVFFKIRVALNISKWLVPQQAWRLWMILDPNSWKETRTTHIPHGIYSTICSHVYIQLYMYMYMYIYIYTYNCIYTHLIIYIYDINTYSYTCITHVLRISVHCILLIYNVIWYSVI